MITEDYVSLEVAKLLKEKGFDEKCLMCWDEVTKTMALADDGGTTNSELLATYISAPTLQMTMKWLREVHKLYVSIIPNPLNYKHQDIQDGWACEVTHLSDLSYDSDYEFFQKKYQTYESACEAAIRYCLQNLI